jgi:tetraacyldisaccharide 4'-kinase
MLRLLGWLYGRIINLRNSFYDRGVFKSHSLGARTISIGNITTGGTGKTPLVAHVAEILADEGEKVCILTRGYGRESSGRVLVSDGNEVLVDARKGGDEPVELARKLVGKAVVVADADRVSSAIWAREKFGVTVFVLDDGFQHRRAKRDLDIVCIDATDPFGGSDVLPAGRLREPVSNLARTDAIVITRSDLVGVIDDLVNQLRDLDPDTPVFKATSKLRSPKDPPDANVFAFCGIGNPQSFFSVLARAGFDIAGDRVFADHHRYTQNDISEIESDAKLASCDLLVTTAKDAVKLDGLVFEMPFLVAEVETIIDDPDGFRDLVLSV